MLIAVALGDRRPVRFDLVVDRTAPAASRRPAGVAVGRRHGRRPEPAADADLAAASALALAGDAVRRRRLPRARRSGSTRRSRSTRRRRSAAPRAGGRPVGGQRRAGEPQLLRGRRDVATAVGHRRPTLGSDRPPARRITRRRSPPAACTCRPTGHGRADGRVVPQPRRPTAARPRYGYEATRALVQLAVDCQPAGRRVAARAWPFFDGATGRHPRRVHARRRAARRTTGTRSPWSPRPPAPTRPARTPMPTRCWTRRPSSTSDARPTTARPGSPSPGSGSTPPPRRLPHVLERGRRCCAPPPDASRRRPGDRRPTRGRAAIHATGRRSPRPSNRASARGTPSPRNARDDAIDPHRAHHVQVRVEPAGMVGGETEHLEEQAHGHRLGGQASPRLVEPLGEGYLVPVQLVEYPGDARVRDITSASASAISCSFEPK